MYSFESGPSTTISSPAQKRHRGLPFILEEMRVRFSVTSILFLTSLGLAQQSVQFPPLEQWKTAVTSHDAVGLKSLYSVFPPAQVNTTSGKMDADASVDFWTGLNAKAVSLRVVERGSPRQDLLAFTAQVRVTGPGGRITNIVDGQTWQNQGGIWRIVGEKRDLAKLTQPTELNQKIYPTDNAREDVQNAVTRAGREHKNVLLVFGADWCYDCHVLDKAFHRPDVAAVLKSNYELVNVDIGEENKNLDIAAQYQVPLNRGVPAIAVLDSTGKLLYSQQSGEWERARALGPEDLIAFLKKWKPSK
jgi:thioredoxin 1